MSASAVLLVVGIVAGAASVLRLGLGYGREHDAIDWLLVAVFVLAFALSAVLYP